MSELNGTRIGNSQALFPGPQSAECLVSLYRLSHFYIVSGHTYMLTTHSIHLINENGQLKETNIFRMVKCVTGFSKFNVQQIDFKKYQDLFLSNEELVGQLYLKNIHQKIPYFLKFLDYSFSFNKKLMISEHHITQSTNDSRFSHSKSIFFASYSVFLQFIHILITKTFL